MQAESCFPNIRARRKGEEGAEASDIAGGVEKIGVFGVGMRGLGEPVLEQRSRRGEREERRPDPRRQHEQDLEDRAVAEERRRWQRWRKRERGEREHDHVKRDLEAQRQPAGDGEAVGVTDEERGLIEHQGGDPGGGRAPHNGQDHFGE